MEHDILRVLVCEVSCVKKKAERTGAFRFEFAQAFGLRKGLGESDSPR